MSIKLLVGQLINYIIKSAIKLNYKLVPFIPGGRILPLDLKRANITPKIIFDVGANIGQTSNYFINHFPQSEIYSFEPVADTYRQLINNSSHSKNISCFNQALGSVTQKSTIYVNSSSGSSSINGKFNDQFLHTETIDINTGHNFCTKNNIEEIDLLKIDTEGFEMEVLKGFEPLLKDHVKMIYAEIGFIPDDIYKTYINDLLSYTSNYGFIVSGFYEPFRGGFGSLRIGFCNILLINTFLVDK